MAAGAEQEGMPEVAMALAAEEATVEVSRGGVALAAATAVAQMATATVVAEKAVVLRATAVARAEGEGQAEK